MGEADGYLPMGQSESMTYDAFGRLYTQTDFAGLQTVYHYDSLGRVYEKDYSGGNNPSETAATCLDPVKLPTITMHLAAQVRLS